MPALPRIDRDGSGGGARAHEHAGPERDRNRPIGGGGHAAQPGDAAARRTSARPTVSDTAAGRRQLRRYAHQPDDGCRRYASSDHRPRPAATISRSDRGRSAIGIGRRACAANGGAGRIERGWNIPAADITDFRRPSGPGRPATPTRRS